MITRMMAETMSLSMRMMSMMVMRISMRMVRMSLMGRRVSPLMTVMLMTFIVE